MYLVPVGQLEVGQVVARAVTNQSGAVLCPPGLELTQAIIDRLASAGVDNVAIEGSGANADRIKARLEALDARFTGVNDTLALELKQTMENRLRAMLPPSSP